MGSLSAGVLRERADALAKVSQDGYCHTVAQGPIAGSVRGGLAAIGDVSVIVREALESLAFSWGKAAHRHPRAQPCPHRISTQTS